MRLVGVLATHYHADHVGGDLFGYTIKGLTDLLERVSVPVHVQRAETPWVMRAAGVGRDVLVGHDSDDVVEVGAVRIRLVHTPGHTPGSQCFLVDGRLVAGDTLFLNGCGRTDLPGSDPAAMYDSLVNRLARLPDDTVVYPGHLYSEEPVCHPRRDETSQSRSRTPERRGVAPALRRLTPARGSGASPGAARRTPLSGPTAYDVTWSTM